MNKHKECYGKMDSSAAENFPYSCFNCSEEIQCQNETIKNIQKSKKKSSYYEFNKMG